MGITHSVLGKIGVKKAGVYAIHFQDGRIIIKKLTIKKRLLKSRKNVFPTIMDWYQEVYRPDG
jgi:hypothetical protein